MRPGEALAAARRAPGAAEALAGPVNAAAAFAWRDFMVSSYDDSGAAAWAKAAGIDVIRGHGRLAGPRRVMVDGESFTARHVVLATGSEPFVPPGPGLRQLPGVWGNREVTGMTEVPRHLLVLGGGPVGVEMAQAVVRLGGSASIVEGMDHLLPREPKRLGEALGTVLESDDRMVQLTPPGSAASITLGKGLTTAAPSKR